jgi:hypothetical protein
MPVSRFNLSRRGFMQSSSGVAVGAASYAFGARAFAAIAEGSNPVVATVQGDVRGVVENGIAIFRGIPYAQAPVGKLRFKPTVRVARWEGVRDATKFGAIAAQTDQSWIDAMSLPKGVPMGDDCLNLNVWTPAPGATRLPVLFWIHGGAFKYGAGSVPTYNGATFAREGVVTVTINYRLGANGFLNIGEKPGSGCFGLLDLPRRRRVVSSAGRSLKAAGGSSTSVPRPERSSAKRCLAGWVSHGMMKRL